MARRAEADREKQIPRCAPFVPQGKRDDNAWCFLAIEAEADALGWVIKAVASGW
jgi:hypothetical protein